MIQVPIAPSLHFAGLCSQPAPPLSPTVVARTTPPRASPTSWKALRLLLPLMPPSASPCATKAPMQVHQNVTESWRQELTSSSCLSVSKPNIHWLGDFHTALAQRFTSLSYYKSCPMWLQLSCECFTPDAVKPACIHVRHLPCLPPVLLITLHAVVHHARQAPYCSL